MVSRRGPGLGQERVRGGGRYQAWARAGRRGGLGRGEGGGPGRRAREERGASEGEVSQVLEEGA